MIVILNSIQNFIASVQGLVLKVWDFLSGVGPFIERLLKWSIDYLKEIPALIAKVVMGALADSINAVLGLFDLSFLSTVFDTSLVTGASQYIPFIIGPFRLGYGLSLVLTAYAVRFIIRRLPIVG